MYTSILYHSTANRTRFKIHYVLASFLIRVLAASCFRVTTFTAAAVEENIEQLKQSTKPLVCFKKNPPPDFGYHALVTNPSLFFRAYNSIFIIRNLHGQNINADFTLCMLLLADD